MQKAKNVISLRKFKKEKVRREEQPDKCESVWPETIFFTGPKESRGLKFYRSGNKLKSKFTVFDNTEATEYASCEVKINRVKAKLVILSQQNPEGLWMIEKVMDSLFEEIMI